MGLWIAILITAAILVGLNELVRRKGPDSRNQGSDGDDTYFDGGQGDAIMVTAGMTPATVVAILAVAAAVAINSFGRRRRADTLR